MSCIRDSNGHGLPIYSALKEGPALAEIWGTTGLPDEAFEERSLMHPEELENVLVPLPGPFNRS
jgi:hypothetical protein